MVGMMPLNHVGLLGMILSTIYRLENTIASQQTTIRDLVHTVDELKARIEASCTKMTNTQKESIASFVSPI